MTQAMAAALLLAFAGQDARGSDEKFIVALAGFDVRAASDDEGKANQLDKLVGRWIGVTVHDVEKDGPAGKAGILKGDVILRLGANKLASRDDYLDCLRVAKPGATFKAAIRRGSDKEIDLEFTLKIPAESKEAPGPYFAWNFAGVPGYEAAKERAKKEGKILLVGLSGAET